MTTIPDGAKGTLVNGRERPIKMVKVREDEGGAIYDLVSDEQPPDPNGPAATPAPTRPVDPPEVAADTGSVLEQKRADLDAAPPVLPSWLRSAREFADNTWTLTCYYAHFTMFHAVRLPVYVGRLVLRAPRGFGRLTRRWFKWVIDAESRPVQARAAADGDLTEWVTFCRNHSARVKPRRIASVAVAAPLLIAAPICVFVLPGWQLAAGAVAMLATLGVFGGKQDKPLVSRYLSVQVQRPLDSEELVQALDAIGIKGALEFRNPVQVDGPGWLAEFDLPRGVLAEKLLDRRKELAGAMRRPLTCVWPSVGSEHPSRVNLWVAKKDPRTIKRTWPLLKSGRVDMYGEFPFGVTPRGEVVPLSLIGTNMLVAGVMGSGKTSAVSVIGCAGALDPTCELWMFELKGSGDLEGLQPVCHRYVQGDDDEHCEAALDGMYALEQEMKRRKKAVASLPFEDVPKGRKITRQLADKYPELRLHPILAIFDEVHTLFEHPVYGGKEGGEAGKVSGRLIRKARAYGIYLVLTTQKPTADAIPKMVADNAILRFCLAITGHTANDLVLGTGMWKRGIRAHIFEPAEGDDPKDSGTGWLTRSAVNARIVRAYFNGQGDIRNVGQRALAMRTAAGTLTGEAAGEEVKPVDRNTVADHLRELWPGSTEAVHSHRLVPALAARWPDLYGAWMDTDKPEEGMTEDEVREVQVARSTTLSAALKPHKVPTVNVTIRGCCGTARGVRFKDLPKPREATDDDEM